MEEDDITETFLSLIGFSMFFTFALAGTMLVGVDPNDFLYVEYDPASDFFFLMGLVFLNFIFLSFFLSKTSKFRKSKNLNCRQNELLLLSDSMLIYSFFYVPAQFGFLFFLIKYFGTALTMILIIILIFQISFLLLIFYNAFRIKKDYKKILEEK